MYVGFLANIPIPWHFPASSVLEAWLGFIVSKHAPEGVIEIWWVVQAVEPGVGESCLLCRKPLASNFIFESDLVALLNRPHLGCH